MAGHPPTELRCGDCETIFSMGGVLPPIGLIAERLGPPLARHHSRWAMRNSRGASSLDTVLSASCVGYGW
jgi:hypothetical protein